MSPIEYIYEARPEKGAWIVVEYIPSQISLEVRIIRWTKTKQEAEDLELKDMMDAPFGWGLNPKAHGMPEYVSIRPEGDGWATVEIVWKPIKTRVKTVGQAKTKEEAEALAHKYQEDHHASVREMHTRWRAGFPEK
jgi:hypothetical protein